MSEAPPKEPVSEKPPELGLENKTALVGIVIGVVIAVVGVAMPLAFDVSPLVWRSAFCTGVVIAAALIIYLIFEHFTRRHPNPHARALRTAGLIASFAAVVGAAIWASIALPQPKNYGALILAKLDATPGDQRGNPAPARLEVAAKPHNTNFAGRSERSSANSRSMPLTLTSHMSMENIDQIDGDRLQISILYHNPGSNNVLIRGLDQMTALFGPLTISEFGQTNAICSSQALKNVAQLYRAFPSRIDKVFMMDDKRGVSAGVLANVTANAQPLVWPLIIHGGEIVDVRATFTKPPMAPPFNGGTICLATRAVGINGEETETWCTVATKYFLNDPHSTGLPGYFLGRTTRTILPTDPKWPSC